MNALRGLCLMLAQHEGELTETPGERAHLAVDGFAPANAWAPLVGADLALAQLPRAVLHESLAGRSASESPRGPRLARFSR